MRNKYHVTDHSRSKLPRCLSYPVRSCPTGECWPSTVAVSVGREALGKLLGNRARIEDLAEARNRLQGVCFSQYRAPIRKNVAHLYEAEGGPPGRMRKSRWCTPLS